VSRRVGAPFPLFILTAVIRHALGELLAIDGLDRGEPGYLS
jgi:hypothetical protein